MGYEPLASSLTSLELNLAEPETRKQVYDGLRTLKSIYNLDSRSKKGLGGSNSVWVERCKGLGRNW